MSARTDKQCDKERGRNVSSQANDISQGSWRTSSQTFPSHEHLSKHPSDAFKDGSKGRMLEMSIFLIAVILSNRPVLLVCTETNSGIRGQSTAAVLHPSQSIWGMSLDGKGEKKRGGGLWDLCCHFVAGANRTPTQLECCCSRFHHPAADRAERDGERWRGWGSFHQTPRYPKQTGANVDQRLIARKKSEVRNWNPFVTRLIKKLKCATFEWI